MNKTCLKCGYKRTASDVAPDYECPKCGRVYAKIEAALKKSADNNLKNSETEVELSDIEKSAEAENGRAVRYDIKEGNSYGAESVSQSGHSNQKVVVTDIQMPFNSMIGFMVKWVIASIPAIIILFTIYAFVTALFDVIV